MKYHISDENIALAQKLAFNWAARINMDMLDDFTSAAYYGLTTAAASYDTERGVKFQTYAYTRINGECAELLRREARWRSRFMLHSQLNASPTAINEQPRVEPAVEQALNQLSGKERKILEEYVLNSGMRLTSRKRRTPRSDPARAALYRVRKRVVAKVRRLVEKTKAL